MAKVDPSLIYILDKKTKTYNPISVVTTADKVLFDLDNNMSVKEKIMKMENDISKNIVSNLKPYNTNETNFIKDYQGDGNIYINKNVALNKVNQYHLMNGKNEYGNLKVSTIEATNLMDRYEIEDNYHTKAKVNQLLEDLQTGVTGVEYSNIAKCLSSGNSVYPGAVIFDGFSRKAPDHSTFEWNSVNNSEDSFYAELLFWNPSNKKINGVAVHRSYFTNSIVSKDDRDYTLDFHNDPTENPDDMINNPRTILALKLGLTNNYIYSGYPVSVAKLKVGNAKYADNANSSKHSDTASNADRVHGMNIANDIDFLRNTLRPQPIIKVGGGDPNSANLGTNTIYFQYY